MDLRTMHAEALDAATRWVLRIDDVERPTPCGPWSLADLTAHMVGQNQGFATSVRNGTAAFEAYAPVPFSAARWTASAEDLVGAFARADLDDGAVDPELAPSPIPIRRLLGAQLLDTVVHTWDVAAALGTHYEPPADVAEQVARIAAAIPDDERRERDGAAFGHAVAGGDSPWETALGRLGREPGWSPGGHP